MSKIETVCPFCKTPILVEKNSFGVSAHGLNKIQCSHCSKRWEEDLSETGSLAKSAPAQSDGMAAVRQRLIELGKVVDDYIARQAATRPARFRPSGDQVQEATVLKFVAGAPGGMMFQTDPAEAPAHVTKAAGSDAVAEAELQKALANGRPVTSPEYVRVGESGASASFQPRPNIAVTNAETPAFGGGAVEKTFTPAPAEHRPFQPNGNTDLSKADAAVRHALANGKRV